MRDYHAFNIKVYGVNAILKFSNRSGHLQKFIPEIRHS